MSKKNPKPSSVPFAMQIIDNPRVEGVLIGLDAMKKAGAQSEFVVANMLQAEAMDCAVILRAGEPPQYDKRRSSKSGLNLSKTSSQSFFKGSLSVEERFARLGPDGNPFPHHEYDRENLNESLTSVKYQHRMQLDVNMQDILRELGPKGDLRVSGFDQGFLRLEYKNGCGPPKSQFNGQFVINLNQGKDKPQFLSRAWNHPENDPNWDPERKIIKKPDELREVPDDMYQKVFSKTFYVNYTEEKGPITEATPIKKAEVFANRPRSVEQFLAAMGEEHPHYELVKNCYSLDNLLNTLKTKLPVSDANETVREVYSKEGVIIAGDWDGMALGHPPSVDPKFTQVINVFEPKNGLQNQEQLLTLSEEYLTNLKKVAQQKIDDRMPLTAFDKKILSIEYFTDIVSDFALGRAGSITPHEFLFQQVLNHAYRDEANAHYGEKYNMDVVQKSMSALMDSNKSGEELHQFARNTLQKDMKEANEVLNGIMLDKLSEHMVNHLKLACESNDPDYKLPHLQHDINVQDLYQHGFDMRNPYGCNLAGAWLLIVDGGVLYGKNQEQLIEVMLTGDFLQKNRIDVNHGADFSAGWDRIIERQLMLGQNVPTNTLENYNRYKLENHSSKIPERSGNMTQQLDMKKQLTEMKSAASASKEAKSVEELDNPAASARARM